MRGYRFFEEYRDPSRSESLGNVIAIQMSETPSFVQPGGICLPAVCAPEGSHIPNSPVRPTYFTAEFLGTYCKRISESRARTIHPKLFEYLDQLS
jgi:hypothetical protein